LQVFQLSLSARQYSAKVEAYRQLAAQAPPPSPACCWAALGARALTSPADLPAAVAVALAEPADPAQRQGVGSAAFAFDHVFDPAPVSGVAPNASDPGALPVVLYAPIGSACAAEWHAALADAARAHDGSDGAPPPALSINALAA
jgi:hypothetical protein